MRKNILITKLVSIFSLISILGISFLAHSDEEKQSSSIGSEKGIVEASEKNGIKLSTEAFRNFEIKTQKIDGIGPWSLPISARVQTGEETNLYRLRNNFFKRIEFTQVSLDEQKFSASSKDLRDGDEIVVSGVGYLRIVEIAAFGGADESHSH